MQFILSLIYILYMREKNMVDLDGIQIKKFVCNPILMVIILHVMQLHYLQAQLVILLPF